MTVHLEFADLKGLQWLNSAPSHEAEGRRSYLVIPGGVHTLVQTGDIFNRGSFTPLRQRI